jgi:hypothetical protein
MRLLLADGGKLLVLLFLPVHKLDAPHHNPADAAQRGQYRRDRDESFRVNVHGSHLQI